VARELRQRLLLPQRLQQLLGQLVLSALQPRLVASSPLLVVPWLLPAPLVLVQPQRSPAGRVQPAELQLLALLVSLGPHSLVLQEQPPAALLWQLEPMSQLVAP